MTQKAFAFPALPIPVGNVHPDERARLSRQCGAILMRLKQSNATNQELSAISLKYTGRISDLRAAGYDVRVVSRDHKTGITVYGLDESWGR
jgi:hypothetical protein